MITLPAKTHLDRLFQQSHTPSLDRIKQGLSLFTQKSCLGQLLEEIAQSERLLMEVAKHSYSHRNGFDKIVLIQSPEYKLRLHVWRPVSNSAHVIQSDIHNHRWDFGSLIIAGSYQFEQYQASEIGQSKYKYNYMSANAGDAFSLQYIGEIAVRKVFECRMVTGTCYSLDANMFHKVEADLDDLTVSLVLQGRAVKKSTLVLLDDMLGTRDGRVEVGVHHLNSSKTKECIQAVLKSVLHW